MAEPFFTKLETNPSYGHFLCQIDWSVRGGAGSGLFRVQKSQSGTGGWRDLNGEGERDIRGFVDRELTPKSRATQTYYRVIFLPDSAQAQISPVVGLFEDYTPLEFNLVRQALKREYASMAPARGGVEVYLYKRLHSGEPCECIDPDTGQSYGSSRCEICYGTKLREGFEPPVRTWARKLNAQARRIGEDGGGRRGRVQDRSQYRVLPYPQPQQGDVLVFPGRDERCAVEAAEIYDLRGVLPVVAHVSTSLLDRNDIRYLLGEFTPPPNDPDDDIGGDVAEIIPPELFEVVTSDGYEVLTSDGYQVMVPA